MPSSPRFLQLADVAEVLNCSPAQAYALVRSGDLEAIKIGGRGQWRVEASALEEFIARKYAETRDFVARHPFGRPDDEEAEDMADAGPPAGSTRAGGDGPAAARSDGAGPGPDD